MNTSNKEKKVLKQAEKKRHTEKQRMNADFSSESVQASDNGIKSLKYRKTKTQTDKPKKKKPVNLEFYILKK